MLISSAKPVANGAVGALALLTFFFAVVSLVSGWNFALSQFGSYWYFIVALSAGFGLQIGLYSHLRQAMAAGASGKMLAVSGGVSGAAMISCCAHYLVNILPIIGVAGVASFIGQYQVEFFWLGLVFNLAGIVYIANRVIKFHKLHKS